MRRVRQEQWAFVACSSVGIEIVGVVGTAAVEGTCKSEAVEEWYSPPFED